MKLKKMITFVPLKPSETACCGKYSPSDFRFNNKHPYNSFITKVNVLQVASDSNRDCALVPFQ